MHTDQDFTLYLPPEWVPENKRLGTLSPTTPPSTSGRGHHVYIRLPFRLDLKESSDPRQAIRACVISSGHYLIFNKDTNLHVTTLVEITEESLVDKLRYLYT